MASARKLRGFFADADRTDGCLHNHTEDGGQIYRYPLVQYKIINGIPTVVAAEEGISSVHPVLMRSTALQIGKQVYDNPVVDLRLSQHRLGDSRDMLRYRFLTSWIALNQRNFARYQQADGQEREELLQKTLVGNLLSVCKAFGVTAERTLCASIRLERVPVFYKGSQMEGFSGEFEVNCQIPDLMGIGKGTARGFGTVKQIYEKGGTFL